MNLIVFRILLLAIGYCFGMIQTAYIYGKAHGIDIREHGSGNAGTTNTLRVLGKKAGLIVFLGDIFKIAIPVFAMGFIWPMLVDNGLVDVSGISGDVYSVKFLWKLYIGLGGVLGHNFPFFLKFKGGKGIAATGGLMLGFYWPFIIVGLVSFFGTFALTNYVSLGSLVLLACFFAATVISGTCKLLDFATIPDPILIEMYILAFIFMALAYIRHIENIKRLIAGNERKTYLFKKNKPE